MYSSSGELELGQGSCLLIPDPDAFAVTGMEGTLVTDEEGGVNTTRDRFGFHLEKVPAPVCQSFTIQP